MKSASLVGVASATVVAIGAVVADQPILRIDQDTVVRVSTELGSDAQDFRPRAIDLCCIAPVAFDAATLARHGQMVPGGGTLSPIAFANPSVINDAGAIAFISSVNGVARNQGVFVGSGGGLTPIAFGCGGGGGSGNPGTSCGDPSPIGGRFSGFYGGTVFAPAINDNGDVLFFCEVDGGSSPRGLFLYRASTHDIIKVAADGDPSPIGGTLEGIGPGTMNNQRDVVFLARNSGSDLFVSNYYKWSAGVVTKIAAIGDAAPEGGTFAFLGRESLGFVDGSTIPIGPVPAINDSGQIAFAAVVSGGPVERGLLLSDGATHDWVVRNTDTTPAGGVYLDFAGPQLNNAGELAFYADVRLSASTFTGGWFAGTAVHIRKVLAFFDSVAGGECFGLAWSRNPMRAIDDCGNVILWTNVRFQNQTERETFVLATIDGVITKLAAQTEPTPIGGTFGSMNAWPARNDLRQSAVSSGTPGAPGGAFSAHFVYDGLRAGDIDDNGVVDLSDLAVLLSNFGTGGATFHDGDFNGDFQVTLEDLALLLAVFGSDC